MNFVKRLLVGLGYLWATPWALIFLILGLPLYLFKQVRPVRWYRGAWDWQVVENSFFYEKWAGEWAATTYGYLILWNPAYMDLERYIVHERRHVAQNWVFGPLFYPLYLMMLLWTRTSTSSWMEAYENHPFEADARAAEPSPIRLVVD